jgi:hypothetical protein
MEELQQAMESTSIAAGIALSILVFKELTRVEKMKGKGDTEFAHLLSELNETGIHLIKQILSDPEFRSILVDSWDIFSGRFKSIDYIF